MSPIDSASRRERPSWPVALLFMLIGFAGGLALYLAWPARHPPAPVVAAAPAPVAEQAAPRPAPVAAPAPIAPSFDVVRIGPQGNIVVAGRAESGAEVTVNDGARVLGRTRADAHGQFVLLPNAVMPPGARELALRARGADGTETAGAGSVILVVPAPQLATAEPPASAVAVLLSPDAKTAPVVLEGRSRKLALDTVDYDDKGDIRFAGSSGADATMRVYVDNQPAGDVKAGAGGQWTMAPASPVTPGMHKLRVDQLGQDGRVIARVELPFQRTAAPPEELANGRAVVQPGQNLWRIARQIYGQGTRYTVIYLANREQIRDPNLIYPGQVFAMPPHS